MKPALFLAAALALSLAACGDKGADSGNGAAPAPSGSVAAVAPPAGKQWADVVSETPEGGFAMGNPDAALKLVEFGSFTCPHCAEFAHSASTEVREMVNTGKLRFEFRNYVRDPLDMTMGLLARCGGAETYFPLMEQLFAAQAATFQAAQAAGEPAYQAAITQPLGTRFAALAQTAGLIDFAKQRGIPEDKAKQCLGDTAAVEKLTKGVQAANEQYNITGTPSLLLNGSLIENAASWDAAKAKLREAGI